MAQKKYFGTDGIRGVATIHPLDPETLVRLGKAIAAVFVRRQGKHRILLAKDTRLSGYMIETALSAGITSMGADVWLSGPIPTPGASYLTCSMRADAGVMISASHNPFDDNGIKIFGSDGCKLDDALEGEIESLLDSESIKSASANPSTVGKATRISDAIGRYTVFLKSWFPRELSMEGLKIGIDCANGAGYIVGPQTFAELGAEVVSRGVSPNGRNINAGFGSLYPEVVAKLVQEQNLEIGIALDGDGDRVILADEKGNVLDGDQIIALVALDMKKRGVLHNNVVVATVMSNLGLERYLNQNGIALVRSPVGDRYVLEEMLKIDASLGGEQSGHILFRDMGTVGDGLLTAIYIISIMVRTGKPLSTLLDGFVRIPQKIVNIKVLNKLPLEDISPIQKILKQKENLLKDRGRVVLRYSGTENKARIMVESEDEDLCNNCVKDIAEVVERELGAT